MQNQLMLCVVPLDYSQQSDKDVYTTTEEEEDKETEDAYDDVYDTIMLLLRAQAISLRLNARNHLDNTIILFCI